MNANYQATEKLGLNFGVVYNRAEGGMEGISLVEPFVATDSNLNTYYSDFEDNFALVETYSDLEYSQLDLTVGGTYNFTERLYTTASLTYSDFDSDEEWVYGDESGESYYGYVGVGYRF